MGYYIYAWLENEKPQLQIIEAESKSICLSWSYQATDANYDKKEIQGTPEMSCICEGFPG